MDLLSKIRRLENLHIVFWLIKDTCWMMEFKLLGAIMIIPALFMAIFIVYHTRQSIDLHINLAILCWISANSYWMFVEFFYNSHWKHLALIPFGLGFLFVIIYYLQQKRIAIQKPD